MYIAEKLCSLPYNNRINQNIAIMQSSNLAAITQNLTHHCTTDFERRSDGVSELMTFLSNKKVVTNDMESATTTLAQRVGFEPTGDCSHDGFRVHAVMTSSVPLHINLVKLFYTVFIILSILQVIIFCDKIFLLHTMEISYGCYY